MSITIRLLVTLGLPQHSPNQEASGTVPAGGGRVTFTIDKEDPRTPASDRFTEKRFEKALNVILNSVVFRSSGQDPTTWCTDFAPPRTRPPRSGRPGHPRVHEALTTIATESRAKDPRPSSARDYFFVCTRDAQVHPPAGPVGLAHRVQPGPVGAAELLCDRPEPAAGC